MGDNTDMPTDGQGQAPVETNGIKAGDVPAEGAGELDVFSFTDADADGDATTPPPDGGEQQQTPDDGYAFDLGADTGIPETLHAPFAAAAKEAGLDGAAAAGFINKALSIVQEQELAANKAAGQALRQEWGNEFDTRVAATKRFMARMSRSAGLTAEQMSVLMSPNGFRLMDAMRRSVGETARPAGGAGTAHVKTPQEELDEIYNDPKQYAALVNPADPRWKEVNARVNRLLNIK